LQSTRDETFNSLAPQHSQMALPVIIFLYVSIGVLAAAGSIFISQKLFSAKGQQIFFALFFVAIAGFYLAFTAYFENQEAWRLEIGAVIVFTVFGIFGLRLPFALIIGYSLHGIWDVVHEIAAHGGASPFGTHEMTQLPLAYGAFCAAFDWCVAGYFYTQRHEWNAAWKARGH
jgi:uncharacterized protein DUF6010